MKITPILTGAKEASILHLSSTPSLNGSSFVKTVDQDQCVAWHAWFILNIEFINNSDNETDIAIDVSYRKIICHFIWSHLKMMYLQIRKPS